MAGPQPPGGHSGDAPVTPPPHVLALLPLATTDLACSLLAIEPRFDGPDSIVRSGMEIGPPWTMDWRGLLQSIDPWTWSMVFPSEKNSSVINIPTTFAFRPLSFSQINPQSKILQILSFKPLFYF
jgi:hypothetical protein